ncbi:WD40 domain-containing protein [Actinoplanes subglobosus]|uniref:Pentapeptide repeat-containing protein n=1 Tax=Actinoplanes subglobosus TaxID=1547892 RepID=A0ABV8IIF8_9ACTN
MISGNIADRATTAEYESAHQFLAALRDAFGLENQQIILVPGDRDVNRGKCEAYFLQCEADEAEPVAPYWEKWQPFSTMLRRFHGTELPKDQPWILTEHPDLRVVVAGLNSTMALTHRPGDRHGHLGDAQIDWFAEQLNTKDRRDWLRIGVMHHRPAGGGAISDADRFAETLGPHLDLVLHGQSGEPAGSVFGRAGVPMLGAGGAWQLIEARPDRARVLPGGPPIRLPHPFPRRLIPHQRRPEPQLGLQRLVTQVAEVCRLRNKGAEVVPVLRPHEARVGYLRVSPARNRTDRGPADQHPVGVCAAVPERADVDWFVEVLARFRTGGSESPAELVHSGGPAGPELSAWARTRGVDLVPFADYQVGPDLDLFAGSQAADLNNDPVYRPDLYVAQRYTEFLPPPAAPSEAPPGTDLLAWLREWVDASRGRLVVVLGTFGHGKTFLLKELARGMVRDASRTIPILIDLRGFEKAYSLDELVAVQLYRQGQRQVDLDIFRYLRREGRITLLFDGFDELATRVSYDRATNHLDTIVQAAEHHAKVVVTSRDQHFLTDSDVLTALGAQLGTDRQVVRLSNFDDEQIVAFLTNRLRDAGSARTRFELMRKVKELLPLSRNPRMLGFITELGEDQLDPAGGPINAALLYRQVLDRWLSYEARRLQRLGPDAPDQGDLMKAVTHLALRLWDQPDGGLSLDDLGDAAIALSQLTATHVGAGPALEPQESAHVLGSSTLLVRSGDQRFTFVHDSVREWLIANHLAAQPPGGIAAGGLIGHKWQPLMIEFLCGLAGADVMRSWAEGILAGQPTSRVVSGNAVKVLRFLGVDDSATPLNMAGVDLRGEDLSGRILVGARLSEADLTDTSLVSVNLTDATLTGATLVGARLDRATLRGADLTGADLSGTRLLGTDLTGAILTGVRLRRAALVATSGVDEESLRNADTHGAALPGVPAEPQIASSTVIHAVAVVSNVRLLAGAGADGVTRIWDAHNGRPLRVLPGHTGPLWATAFTADGRFLASAGDDETVRVWDTATGHHAHTLVGHTGRIRALAFSPDGKHLASAGDDEDIRIWDTDSGRTVRALHTGSGRIHALAYQPRGGHLASAGDDEAVSIWDTGTGQAVYTLTGHTGTVYALAYDPAGTRIASASDDRRVLVWDVAAETVEHRLSGHTQCVRALAFHPDGRWLASGGDEGAIRVWDSHTGSLLRPLNGHAGRVHTLAYYPDGEHLASAGDDRTVRIWDTADRRPERTLRSSGGNSQALCFSARPGDPWLAVGSSDGAVRLWSQVAGVPPRVLSEPAAGQPAVTAIAVTDDGLLATACGDGTIRIWDTPAGAPVRHLAGHRGVVHAIAFAPGGRHLASAGADGTVRLWDLAGAEDPRIFAGERSTYTAVAFRSVAFTPDGQSVACGGTNGTIRIWHLATREPHNVSGHTSTVRAIAFSPDGRQMASADEDAVIRLRHAGGGTPIALTGHTGAVTTLAYAPSGSHLATGGTDGTIRIWDTLDGRPTHTLTGQPGWIQALGYAPDGRHLAAAGGDHAVRIWDTSRATPHAILVPLAEEGSMVHFHDQRYTLHGRLGDECWYAIGLCRFDSGELDPYVPAMKPAPPGEPLW